MSHFRDSPVTYYMDHEFLMDELDHAEMIALSGIFRKWALWEQEFTPSECTKIICWSADLDRLAAHVGPHWRAANPEGSIVQSLASNVQRSPSVIDARVFFKHGMLNRA